MKTLGAAVLRGFFQRAFRDPQRAEIGLHAASGAYYLFLSIGPMTALILSILPCTSVTEQAFFEALSSFAPPALAGLIRAVSSDIYAAPKTALGLSILAELWSAAKLLSSVVRGVEALSGGSAAGYLRRRLLGAGFTLILLVFILGNLMLLLFGERIAATVGAGFPTMEPLCRVLLSLRPLILLGGLTSVNTLLYRCPPGKQRALPGAAVSAAAWLLFTRGYSFFLERFGLFGVYGSIAAVCITLFWAYWSLYILYLGAWLNRFIPPRGSPQFPEQ